MFDQLHRALYRGSGSVDYAECRNCGSTIDDGRPCPECGSREVASYSF